MIWYVHRRSDGSIASAHSERRPGYAEEAVEDADSELQEILNPPAPPPPADPLVELLIDKGIITREELAARRSAGSFTTS